jgi:TrmH family RNA methyltransferase
LLTSVRNPKVVEALRLQRGSARDREGRFLVEGAQGVREALAEVPPRLARLFVIDPLEELSVRARRVGVEVVEVSEDVMRRLTSTVTPQGLVGVAPTLDVSLDALDANGCWTVLHEVRDPGNAGTVLRSADAAGATGVVFTATSVDPYNPKAVRASAGSLFHVPISRGAATEDAIAAARTRGMRVVALDRGADEDVFAVDLAGPIAFVFGNEARGLPDEVLAASDVRVRVPHEGRAESLNLAAAASVVLFERMRRRRSSP